MQDIPSSVVPLPDSELELIVLVSKNPIQNIGLPVTEPDDSSVKS